MTIFGLLRKYQSLFSQNKFFKITDTELIVSHNDFKYLEINDTNINLFNIDIALKLLNKDNKNWDNFDLYLEFINRIKNNITKLNHLGFGYRVDDLEKELSYIRNHLTDKFELVEEESGDLENNRWFFLKNKTDSSVVKIELVFYLSDKYSDFCPQFQFDIDTDLSYNSIREITDELLGKNFFFWKYDVPKYGIVMAMGKIGQIDGVNILIGVGTNLRKKQTFETVK